MPAVFRQGVGRAMLTYLHGCWLPQALLEDDLSTAIPTECVPRQANTWHPGHGPGCTWL